MSEGQIGGRACDANFHGGDTTGSLGAADWLSLAAAPAFAIMALLTAAYGGPAEILCSAAHGSSSLSGMVPMYLLMSLFHSAPWLKLISSRRGGIRLSGPESHLNSLASGSGANR